MSRLSHRLSLPDGLARELAAEGGLVWLAARSAFFLALAVGWLAFVGH